MKKIGIFLVIILFACSCQTTSNSNESSVGIFKKLSKEEFAKKIEEKKDEILIDVRTPKEHQAGTINGAINIDYYNDNFEQNLSHLDKTKPIFIFCQKGGRSGKALNKMKILGFQEVYDLEGGYSGWKN